MYLTAEELSPPLCIYDRRPIIAALNISAMGRFRIGFLEGGRVPLAFARMKAAVKKDLMRHCRGRTALSQELVLPPQDMEV